MALASYKYGSARALPVHPPCFSFFFMAPSRRFSAVEKGKAHQVEPASPPPKRGRGRPRKHPVATTAAPRGRGDAFQRGGGRIAAAGGCAPAARPPMLRFRAAEALPEFVVWSAEPTSTWLPLPRFLLGELPAGTPGGLWLQADGCYSRASWASLEVSAAGSLALARGWQTFARARGLSHRCTLHIKFDGDATLYVRVFGEDGRRAGCFPEGDDRGWEPSSGNDGEGSARVAGGAQGSPSFSGFSSGGDSSSGGRGQPPRRRAPVKRERESS